MKLLLGLVYLVAAIQAEPPPPDGDPKPRYPSHRSNATLTASPRMSLTRNIPVLEQSNNTVQSATRHCKCGIPNRSTRIVGGVETEMNEYPWQVGLVYTGRSRTWCGGTLISSRYVLSAAHCTITSRPSSIEVLLREHRIGVSDGELRDRVVEILNHFLYEDFWRTGYDVSILTLSQPVSYTYSVSPACLPTNPSNMYVGSNAVVTGWGDTSSGGSQATTLQEVTVPVISNDVCRNSYSTINPTMICAGLPTGGQDACQGDSGGPMVTLENDRYTLIGVVSWGIGCALPDYPGVYARVTSVIDWIRDNTPDAMYCN